MSGFGGRFDADELPPAIADHPGSEGLVEIARDLEGFAEVERAAPSAGFEDRVMAAIAAEPPPRVSLRGAGLAGLAVAVRDAWRIAVSGGRPAAIRAQALALVLLVAVAATAVGGAAVAGAYLLSQDRPTPPPSLEPSLPPPSALPSPSLPPPSPSPTPSPSPSPTQATEAPVPTPDDTDEPDETDEPEDTDEPDDS